MLTIQRTICTELLRRYGRGRKLVICGVGFLSLVSIVCLYSGLRVPDKTLSDCGPKLEENRRTALDFWANFLPWTKNFQDPQECAELAGEFMVAKGPISRVPMVAADGHPKRGELTDPDIWRASIRKEAAAAEAPEWIASKPIQGRGLSNMSSACGEQQVCTQQDVLTAWIIGYTECERGLVRDDAKWVSMVSSQAYLCPGLPAGTLPKLHEGDADSMESPQYVKRVFCCSRRPGTKLQCDGEKGHVPEAATLALHLKVQELFTEHGVDMFMAKGALLGLFREQSVVPNCAEGHDEHSDDDVAIYVDAPHPYVHPSLISKLESFGFVVTLNNIEPHDEETNLTPAHFRSHKTGKAWHAHEELGDQMRIWYPFTLRGHQYLESFRKSQAEDHKCAYMTDWTKDSMLALWDSQYCYHIDIYLHPNNSNYSCLYSGGGEMRQLSIGGVSGHVRVPHNSKSLLDVLYGSWSKRDGGHAYGADGEDICKQILQCAAPLKHTDGNMNEALFAACMCEKGLTEPGDCIYPILSSLLSKGVESLGVTLV